MAGKLSVYSANLVLDKILKSVDFTPPASYWVALFTGDPSVALRANNIGSATEVANSGAYTRKEVRGSTGITFSTAVAGASENTAVVTWAAASASWGTITYVALLDSATHGAGNVIMYGTLVTPKPIDIGDTARISTGALDILL